MPSIVQPAADERERTFRGRSHESINDALIECVKALGGSKQVGPVLFPDLAPDAAQRRLLDCLNEDRPQQLTPAQVVLVLRRARAIGCHVGMQYLADELGYAEPQPIEPEDERAKLQREFIESTRQLAALAAQIERIGAPVRSAA